MGGLDWLTARPIAHRGLHDATAGVIENTATAFKAAIDGGYGIETDVQISADGEAMVHHDEALGRLTEGEGRLDGLTAAQIKAVPFRQTDDRIMTLAELCELVDEDVALVVEVKSFFEGDTRLAKRVAAMLASYKGPAAVMSFDPQVIEAIRIFAPRLTRGVVAERHYSDSSWRALSPGDRGQLAFFLHAPRTRPQFIAYSVKDLPACVPAVARRVFGVPVLAWTVRSESDRHRASSFTDQMIFEGFRP